MSHPEPHGTSSELLAERLFKALVGDLNATLPDINLFDDTHTIPWDSDSDVFKPVEKLNIEDLVRYFNALMGGFDTHLEREFDKNRITGAEYSKAYVALTQTAMASAVQYALGKDQAFWLAAKTQADAISAHNQNEVIKLEAMLRRATYALTKLKLATEDSGFGVSELQRTEVLPKQVILTEEQTQMVHEQMEAQRAQTLNEREDGITRITDADPSKPLQGLLGIQKALYTQQITSYQEDVKVKATKVFTDLWTVSKTIDDNTTVPKHAYVNPADGTGPLNEVLTELRKSTGAPAVP